MAFYDHSLPAREPVSRRIARLFETPFAARQRRLAARVAELRGKSDAELARMGLHREEIIPYVFGARR